MMDNRARAFRSPNAFRFAPIERRRFTGAGQCAPVSAQACSSAPNSALVPGAGVRPGPGFQPQLDQAVGRHVLEDRGDVAAAVAPGSLSCSQI